MLREDDKVIVQEISEFDEEYEVQARVWNQFVRANRET